MGISRHERRVYRSGNKQVEHQSFLWVWFSRQVFARGYTIRDDSYYKLSALYNISNYCNHWQKRKLQAGKHMILCSCKNMILEAFLPGRGKSVQQSHRCRKHLLAHPSFPVTSRPLWAAQVFWPGRSSPFHIWKDTAQDSFRILYHTQSNKQNFRGVRL